MIQHTGQIPRGFRNPCALGKSETYRFVGEIAEAMAYHPALCKFQQLRLVMGKSKNQEKDR